MFGRKKDDDEAPKEEAPKAGSAPGPEAPVEDPCAKADSLMRETLDELNRGLAVKRQTREKTTRFVGSLRPVLKAR